MLRGVMTLFSRLEKSVITPLSIRYYLLPVELLFVHLGIHLESKFWVHGIEEFLELRSLADVHGFTQTIDFDGIIANALGPSIPCLGYLIPLLPIHVSMCRRYALLCYQV